MELMMKFNGSGLELTAAMVVILSVSYVQAEVLGVDERLITLVATYADLLVCADTARTYEADDASAQAYQASAFKLQDKIGLAGWSSNEIATAVVMVNESRAELAVESDVTRESYRRRNFSEEYCRNQMIAAQDYLSGAIPESRSEGRDSPE